MKYTDSPFPAGYLQTVQSLAAGAVQLRQAAAAPLTDQLALCLAAELANVWLQPAAAQTPATTPDLNRNLNPNLPAATAAPPANGMDTRPVDPLQRVKELCPLVALLRRGDQYAERLQIRRQWLDFAAEKHRDRLAAQKAKTDHTSLPVHEGGLSDETIAKIEQKLNLL